MAQQAQSMVGCSGLILVVRLASAGCPSSLCLAPSASVQHPCTQHVLCLCCVACSVLVGRHLCCAVGSQPQGSLNSFIPSLCYSLPAVGGRVSLCAMSFSLLWPIVGPSLTTCSLECVLWLFRGQESYPQHPVLSSPGNGVSVWSACSRAGRPYAGSHCQSQISALCGLGAAGMLRMAHE